MANQAELHVRPDRRAHYAHGREGTGPCPTQRHATHLVRWPGAILGLTCSTPIERGSSRRPRASKPTRLMSSSGPSRGPENLMRANRLLIGGVLLVAIIVGAVWFGTADLRRRRIGTRLCREADLLVPVRRQAHRSLAVARTTTPPRSSATDVQAGPSDVTVSALGGLVSAKAGVRGRVRLSSGELSQSESCIAHRRVPADCGASCVSPQLRTPSSCRCLRNLRTCPGPRREWPTGTLARYRRRRSVAGRDGRCVRQERRRAGRDARSRDHSQAVDSSMSGMRRATEPICGSCRGRWRSR